MTFIVDRFTEERLTEGRLTVGRSTADSLTIKSIMNGEKYARTGQLQINLKRTLDRVTVKRGVFNGEQANSGQANRERVIVADMLMGTG